MMEPVRAPRLIVTVINALHGNDEKIGEAALACAGALLGMMAISTLTAWQAGLL